MARNGLMPNQDEKAVVPHGSQMAAGDPEDGGEDAEQPNVSPEEQAQYEAFVDNAFNLIYEQKPNPKTGKSAFEMTLEALQGDGNFVDGLAHTTVTIVMRVLDSAKQAKQPISGDVAFAAGQQIMEDLAETAGKAGIHDYTQDEIDAAYLRAMDLARERLVAAGDVDPEKLKTEFAAVIAADRQGRLEEFMPGAEAFATREVEGEPEEPEPDDDEEMA